MWQSRDERRSLMTLYEITDVIEGAVAIIDAEMTERKTPSLAVVKAALERCIESLDAMDDSAK